MKIKKSILQVSMDKEMVDYMLWYLGSDKYTIIDFAEGKEDRVHFWVILHRGDTVEYVNVDIDEGILLTNLEKEELDWFIEELLDSVTGN